MTRSNTFLLRTLAVIFAMSLLLSFALAGCGKDTETDPVNPDSPPADENIPLLPRPEPSPGGIQNTPADTSPRFDPEVNPNPNPISRPEYKEEPKIIEGPDGKKYLNNQILVKFAGTVTAGQATAFADNYKATVAAEQPVEGAYRIDLDDPLSYDDLLIMALKMKTDQTVVDAWLEPIPEFGDSTASSQDPASSEAPPAVVSSEGNVLIYDKSPDIPDVDPYGSSSQN